MLHADARQDRARRQRRGVGEGVDKAGLQHVLHVEGPVADQSIGHRVQTLAEGWQIMRTFCENTEQNKKPFETRLRECVATLDELEATFNHLLNKTLDESAAFAFALLKGYVPKEYRRHAGS